MKITEMLLSCFDSLDFFSKLGPQEKKTVYFTSGEWTIVAWNPVRMIQSKTRKVFEVLKKANQRRSESYKGVLPFIGGFIGYLDYDAAREGGVFHEYHQAILWNGTTLFAVGDRKFTKEVREIAQRRIVSSAASQTAEDMDLPLRWKPSITRTQYASAFKKIQRDIRNGEYYQLNLTYMLEAELTRDRRQLFCALARENPSSCMSYFEDGDLSILSLSPERFVTIEDGRITTCPIKGTRPRGKNAAEDVKFRNELLKSAKEEAELNMITDLLRNDIGKVSRTGSVKVLAHRKLQKNPTVWHTYSVIEGRLLPDLHPVQALHSMFPGGSITGCPKQVVVERIAELEQRKRGPYCGSMILLSDSGYLDSTILIRTIVAKGNHLSLGIGGGIVADSVLEDEWQETRQKAKAFEGLGMGLPTVASAKVGVRVWVNGKIASADDSALHLLSPSNLDSYGVFETMRIEHGRVVDLKEHLQRLQKSAKLLKMKLPKPIQKINDWICRSSQPSSLTQTLPSRLKIVCTPYHVLLEHRHLVIDPTEKKGISALFVKAQRALPAGKILPYYREWEAHQEALRKGFSEALLVDRSGHVPEAAYANIFWVRDGVLCTAGQQILEGITRAQVLIAARALQIPVRFTIPKKSDLLIADEVFLTKSTTGITPVTRINRALIGSGKRGPMTEDLMKKLERL